MFYKKIIKYDNLIGWVNNQKELKKNIVLTTGCFDLLHIGHASYLEKAKELGDILLVGINSDESVKKLKGKNRPINTAENRALLISSLQMVDNVCIFPELTAQTLIRTVRPDVFVKGNGEINEEEKALVSKLGGKFYQILLENDVSTTKILDKLRI